MAGIRNGRSEVEFNVAGDGACIFPLGKYHPGLEHDGGKSYDFTRFHQITKTEIRLLGAGARVPGHQEGGGRQAALG